MQADIYTIQHKARPPGVSFANISDFELKVGGHLSVDELSLRDTVSLYCLDLKSRCAVFVEGDTLTSLADEPFLYLGQYKGARRVWTLAFDDFIEWSGSLEDPRKLIFVHSTGRCGSTLVSRLLGRLPNSFSLSEPDALCDLVLARFYRPENTDYQQQLFRACIRALCKDDSNRRVSIKGRSFTIELADWMHASYPHARHLFIYRNIYDWIESIMRAFPANTTNAQRAAEDARRLLTPLVPLLRRSEEGEMLSLASVHALMWKSTMMSYIELHKSGANAHALDYDALLKMPHGIVRSLSRSLGLEPISAQTLNAVMNRDSQENSPLARATLKSRHIQLSPADLKDIERQLGTPPALSSSHFEVPNELQPS
jgi:hypothetical protein